MTSSTPGTWMSPPKIARNARMRHRDPHRRLALGDVVLGPREADVGVLGLAGRRVDGLGVGEVALLELARLLVGLAAEDAEDRSGTRRRPSAARRCSRRS